MAASIAARACRRYLVHLANDHVDFRIPEIEAVASIFGLDMKISNKLDKKNPFVEIELSSEKEARQLMSRTVLAKSIYELWATGCSYEDLHSDLKRLPQAVHEPHTREDVSFRIDVTSFNKSIPQRQKVDIMENILDGHVKFKGPVCLQNPDQRFQIFERHNVEQNVPRGPPLQVFFGRWICDSQRQKVRNYNLQERKFIANTSMDPELAFIMANLGKANRSQVIFDPFVGSGSLLVACAYYGAYVMGADIDYKLLYAIGKTSRAGKKWRAKDETIRNNMRQYQLEQLYLDAVVADSSKAGVMWRQEMTYDAIITDPPYGIREAARKLGSSKDEPSLSNEFREGHIPMTQLYSMTEILVDLLNFAARSLKLGGRLVYWLPVYRDLYREENIPHHPCLQCVANCEQVLNSRVSRRLITMEKNRELQGMEVNASIAEDHYEDMSFRERYFKAAAAGGYESQGVNDSMECSSDLSCQTDDRNVLKTEESVDEQRSESLKNVL